MGKIIALGGNIASGKSTVSAILRELGAYIIDTDMIARDIVKPYHSGWHGIVREFGWEYILPDNNIDRVKLGNLIFSDRSSRLKLNSITHPLIREIVQKEVDYINLNKPDSIIVIVIPLLFESDFPVSYNESWFVASDDEKRLMRLMERDKISREKALIKINAQMSQGQKIEKADKVFYNNTDVAELKRDVINEYNKLADNKGNI